MTDPITCPECKGCGETSIGPLRLLCRFCRGLGEVGGDNEPAEGGQRRSDGYRSPRDGEEYDREVHGPLPAVWDHPATSDLPGCHVCLGTGIVISLGDIYSTVPENLVEMPCPHCTSGQ